MGSARKEGGSKHLEKEISHIKVNNTRQIFWVNNPKKIKYWISLAERAGKTAFQSGSASPSIQILKVVYK